jgi:DHA1 family bicyclomycin/chloramphenicol resistance-like MFS transporter
MKHGQTENTNTPSPRLIILLGSLTAFSPLAIDMYLPAFPQIERDLSAPTGKVPLSLSFFLAGLAIGQFVVGPISDRLGRRVPLMIGCTVFALAAGLCMMATSVWWLIAARFLMGLAGAAGLVISRAVVRDLFDETESAGIYSFIMMVTGVAPVVAPLLGGFILMVGSWRMVFLTLAAIGGVCGLAVHTTLRESLPLERRSQKSALTVLKRSFGILTDPRFIGYALAIGCSYGALFAYITASPTVFIEIYEMTPQRFSWLFASNAVGIFLAAQLNRRLLHYFGPHRILMAAAIIATIAGCLLALEAWTGLGGFYAFYATLFVCVATLGLIFPNATAAAMVPFGAEAGAASAVLGLLQYVVGAIVAAVVGLLYDGTARPMAGAVAVCEIVVLVVVLATERYRRRQIIGEPSA